MTLNRYAIWGANAGLFVLCCFLLGGVIAEVAAARLAPPPAEVLPGAAAERAAPGTPRPDRQAILDRNLFGSSLDEGEAPPAPEVVEEDLEATQLPLALLGTAASPARELSWAAIDDLEERQHKVVTAGSAVKPGVEVVRIERARVVLRNGGKLEELLLADDGPETRTARRRPTPAPQRGLARRERTESLADRVRQVSESRFEVDREDVVETVRNPAALFSEARILPRYEDGQMMGIQLNAIKQGSLFEEVGLADGDTIVEFNGQSLASPADSAAFLQQLMDGSNFEVLVQDPNGTERTLTFEAN